MKTYDEFIQNILNTRGRFACGEEYHERHHIIPRCMGGTNEKDNLIDLYAREHFEAHKLLALENPENNKLVYVWSCMAFAKRDCQERYELTPEEYEDAKVAISRTSKGRTFSDETRKKMSESAKARCTEEWKRNVAERNKGRWAGENNPNYGNHNWAGENNPRYKNPLCGKENGRAKSVIQLTKDLNFIKRWDYISEAAIFLGKDISNIISCCKYKIPSAYGYVWVYEDEYLSGEYLMHYKHPSEEIGKNNPNAKKLLNIL